MVHATEEEIYGFLKQFKLNPGFVEFVRLCQASNVDLFVVSDGLDFYIRRLLKRNSLEHLPVIANRGKLENGGITVEFTHHNRTCRRCGNCKGERIQEYRNGKSQKTRIVFVGDGYSDTCATAEADLIFAKKDLEQYCLINDIVFYKYDDFFDVARKMMELGYLRNG
jgi:2,3-diketo-5-methylthio-1-phosphopentane phosphatase